ncbi:Multicopper oxidase [Phytophthora cactorum]|nr:Multicopper oxidase [Phytophthora cactorum]
MTAFDGVLLETLGGEAVIGVELGQEVEVRVTNELYDASCLHWHGMKQLGTQEMDGVSGFTNASSNQTPPRCTASSPTRPALFGGTVIISTVCFRSTRSLIVHAPESDLRDCQKEIDEEYIIQLRDIYTPLYFGPALWNTIVINNRGRFNCTAAALNNLTSALLIKLSNFYFKEGRKYLLRLINMAAMAPFEFSIDDHEFQIIAADGEPVQPTELINAIFINAGQRYDIVVQAKNETSSTSQQQVESSPMGASTTASRSLMNPLLTISNGSTTADLPVTANARAIEYGKHVEGTGEQGGKELQQKGPECVSSSLLSVSKGIGLLGASETNPFAKTGLSLLVGLKIRACNTQSHKPMAMGRFTTRAQVETYERSNDRVRWCNATNARINDKSSHEAHIKIELGQEVEVHVTNELSEPTCLHWHGMKQLGTQEMDGMSGFTQCAIEPNRSATYRYTPDKAGTFWWHSHHGTQYAYGLRGPLTVHAPESETQSWNEEYTIQMADIYHTPPPPGPVLWDSIVVNNLGRYDCTAAAIHNLTDCESHQPLSSFDFQPGKKYLLRLINMAAMATFEFSIDGHEFQVIAADAEPVVPTDLINSIIVNVGQRYDVVVQAKEDTEGVGSFWMRVKGLTGYPWTARAADTGTVGFSDEGLAIIRYDSGSRSEPTSEKAKETKTIGEFDFTSATLEVLPATPDDRSTMRFNINTTIGTGIVSLEDGEFQTMIVPDQPPLLSIASGLTTADLPISANAELSSMASTLRLC